MSVEISNGSIDQQIAKLMTCQVIKESEVKNLCTKYKEILSKYPNVQTLSSPVTVTVFYFKPLDLWRRPWSIL
jgi:hypothetical protein